MLNYLNPEFDFDPAINKGWVISDDLTKLTYTDAEVLESGNCKDIKLNLSVKNVDLVSQIVNYSEISTSACSVSHRDNLPESLPELALLREKLAEVMADGGSCIAGPDGRFVIEPVVGREELLLAQLDHARVREERQNFDPFGHYSRPELLSLAVDGRRVSGFQRLHPEA